MYALRRACIKKINGELDPLRKKFFGVRNHLFGLLIKLNSYRHISNMRFGMSVSMFRLNIIGMTPVVVLVM